MLYIFAILFLFVINSFTARKITATEVAPAKLGSEKTPYKRFSTNPALNPL